MSHGAQILLSNSQLRSMLPVHIKRRTTVNISRACEYIHKTLTPPEFRRFSL